MSSSPPKGTQESSLALLFSERLREAVKEEGGRAEVARRSGIGERMLARYMTGGTEPGLFTMRTIADAVRRPLEWFFGQDELDLGTNLSPDLVMVPRYDVRASAGLGAIVPSEEVTDYLAFRRDWFTRIGVSSEHAILAEIAGDSMEPTIPDGALILINTAVHRVQNGYIYAIRREDELLVKRVQIRVDGTVVLISDNARYDREEFSADRAVDLHVVGQVVWNAYALVGKGRL